MIKISKKNNKHVKWNRAHIFKRQKSNKNRVGHPVYVYGTNNRSYKYLLFTHDPPKGQESDFEKLMHNIDSAEDGARPSYMKKNFEVSRRDSFVDPDKNYRIHNDDKLLIKKYKK